MRVPQRAMPWRRPIAIAFAVFALGGAVAAVARDGGTLRVAFSIAESTFDPQSSYDAASDSVVANIYEQMLDYDYLARPVKLVPRTLEAMPTVQDNGATYLCKLRKGIFFTADAAFKGKPRELTAADYAHAFKRLLDPAVHSPWLWLIEGKIVGGDEARALALRSGRFDYDAPIAGLEVVDRHTLKIRLREPDLRFLYVLAVPSTAAVAREVVDAYGQDFGAHPVGTGPYVLGEYRRNTRITLNANPNFREVTYTPAGPIPADAQPIAAALKGRRLPLPARIEVSIIEEGQSRWLAFLNRELDLLEQLPSDFVDQAIANGKIHPSLAAKGMRLDVLLRPNTYWNYFNMRDPVVGGYTPEKIALRRAIGMGFDVDEQIRVLAKGRAVPAKGPVPPDIAGYDPALRTTAQLYDPAAARALLDKFGYKDRDGDSYRERPDGKPLVIERWSSPTSAQRQADELWKKKMDAIGVRMGFKKDKLPELRKMARQGKIPMRADGWNADYPDAENYMQLLYGPNAGQANESNFDLPEFNRLYDEARKLPDSPARTRIFDRMTELVIAYAPWRLTVHILEDHLMQPTVRHYKAHPIRSQVWQWIDLAPR
jgi:ABC-type transport system substrate-binding protein